MATGRPREKNFAVEGKNGKKYRYVRLVRTINGKQRQFTGKDRAEAEAKYKAYLEKLASEKKLDGRDTFGQWAEHYIDDFLMHDEYLALNSRRLYADAWHKYVAPTDIYSLPLLDVDSATLQRLFNRLDDDVSKSTQVKIYNLLKKFYAFLAAQDICADITTTLTRPRRPDVVDTIETWTPDEIRKILTGFDKARADFRLTLLIKLAYLTGMRLAELLALQASDVKYNDDLDLHYISVSKQLISTRQGFVLTKPKTKSAIRRIPIDQTTVYDILVEHGGWQVLDMAKHGYKNPQGFLFTTKSGGFYDQHNIARALQRYYEKIGVPPKGFHTYRRTFATLAANRGVPIHELSKILGHSSTAVTARYYVDTDIAIVGQHLQAAGLDSVGIMSMYNESGEEERSGTTLQPLDFERLSEDD